VHIDGPLIKGLLRGGWDVARVVDAFDPTTKDDVLLEKAAALGRIFVTNDQGIHAVAVRWIREGRRFPGMVFWKKKHHERMTTGDFITEFERLAQRDNPFEYPIQYITPE
jgi:hypothetical protein